MTTTYLAEAALLDGPMASNVASNVAITVDADGVITHLGHDAPPGADAVRVAGLVVPGIPNLHAHAFQRAMAGLAERAGPEGDNFWRWREVMYRFLAVLTPDDVEAIAAQLYVENLRHGYTAVAEFHYLHNAPDGRPYDDPAEMAHRILAAADEAGIGLTLLPVLYRQGGFGAVPPAEGQRRFVLSRDQFQSVCERVRGRATTGIAPHSLRAVTPGDLDFCIALAAAMGRNTPLHLHVAEQVREVEECIAWNGGARPVAWLLGHAPVDARWCAIHATHMEPAERTALAATGAVAGLCQTTEANLGDGVFPLRAYLGDGGRFGIGTDSNVSTSPVEELRWLEYVRRLETRARNVTESRHGASVATGLIRRAAAGGAQALARKAGRIAEGHMADLVVLDATHPALVGRSGESLLDAWVFSGNATAVRDVMVAGRWVVRDGRHEREEPIRARFAAVMRRLLG